MTINNIITRNNRYSNIVDDNGNVVLEGSLMSKSKVTSRNTLNTHYVGGEYEVNIEKFEMVVCGYSKIREYRRQKGGYRPYNIVKYRYTYTDGQKRLTSRDFKSLDKLMKDLKEKTSIQEVLTILMEA